MLDGESRLALFFAIKLLVGVTSGAETVFNGIGRILADVTELERDCVIDGIVVLSETVDSCSKSKIDVVNFTLGEVVGSKNKIVSNASLLVDSDFGDVVMM